MSYIVDVWSYLRPDAEWIDQVPVEACAPIPRDGGA